MEKRLSEIEEKSIKRRGQKRKVQEKRKEAEPNARTVRRTVVTAQLATEMRLLAQKRSRGTDIRQFSWLTRK